MYIGPPSLQARQRILPMMSYFFLNLKRFQVRYIAVLSSGADEQGNDTSDRGDRRV